MPSGEALTAHRSTVDHEATIKAYTDAHIADARPFIWRNSAEAIRVTVQRFCQRIMRVQATWLETSESGH